MFRFKLKFSQNICGEFSADSSGAEILKIGT